METLSKLTLNIGLNVGTIEPLYQKQSSLIHVFSLFDAETYKIRLHKGQYTHSDGTTVFERTLVIELHINIEQKDIESKLQILTKTLHQESIAYYFQSESIFSNLVYSDTHKGEKFAFNLAYFEFF